MVRKPGMKYPIGMPSLLTILVFLTACSKTTGTSDDMSTDATPGKWNVISDSAFEGVGTGNHAVDYTGVAGDYFSFNTNGDVYTKEGNKLDTLTYRIVSASGIIISDFGLILNGVPDTSTITGLTGNITSDLTGQTIVIESPFFPTPGGLFWRKVTLSR
jgi:hypothetical protein